MPLKEGASNKARETNIEKEIDAGKPPEQAVAIGYSVQRKAKHRAPRVPWGKKK